MKLKISKPVICSSFLDLQALEALRKLKSEKTQEVKEFKLRLDHLKTHKVRVTIV